MFASEYDLNIHFVSLLKESLELSVYKQFLEIARARNKLAKCSCSRFTRFSRLTTHFLQFIFFFLRFSLFIGFFQKFSMISERRVVLSCHVVSDDLAGSYQVFCATFTSTPSLRASSITIGIISLSVKSLAIFHSEVAWYFAISKTCLRVILPIISSAA